MLKRWLRELPPQSAASLDDILFGRLLFDFFRERFGEDSSRTGIPEAAAGRPIRFDMADLSRKSRHAPPKRW
jgi:hypothetical protein